MRKLIVATTLFFFVFAQPAFTQEFNVSVEPTVIQIDADAPAQIEAPFAVKNLSSNTIELSYKLIPFEADKTGNGKVNLLLGEKDDLSSIIKDRLKIIDEDKVVTEITLRPNEAKVFRAFLELREGDPVGDYYFSLVFMSEGRSLKETSTSAIPGGIAVNVMLSLGPKVAATGEIEEFYAPSFLPKGPVPFALKIKNTGNHLIQPRGFVSIKNLFGKEVGKLNLLPQYILANSSRYMADSEQASPSAENGIQAEKTKTDYPTAVWNEPFILGPYTADARITLEDGGSVLIKTTRFYAFPLQLMFLASAIIFIILGIGFRVYVRLKSRGIIKS